MAAEGQIENVLVYSPDRLSRKYAYQVLLVEEFARHGVEVIFIRSPRASTPEEHLLVQFQGMIAEYERAQIAERTRRGKRYRAKTGLINVLSGAPYGYRYVKKTETTASYYEIVEQEAEVVRKVFECYTEVGLSIGAIARWLNDHEIPNKRFSSRRTIEPTLLHGMLVCGECGYAYYRTSTRTSKRKIYYYRCLGSDDYRHINGRVCQNRPIRQDYLDETVWKQVIELLEDPALIRQEIQRRLQEIQNSNPIKKRKEVLDREIARQQKSIERLLDAYQEGLLGLEELRRRLPNLRKRSESLQSELRSLEATTGDRQALLRLADNLENFLERLRCTADTLDVIERQKILRLVVKEILIHKETIKIRHSIPITGTPAPSGVSGREDIPRYLLRSGSQWPTLRRPFSRGTNVPSANWAGALSHLSI